MRRDREPEYRGRIRKQAQNHERQTRRERDQADQRKGIERLIAAIGSITQQQQRSHDESERQRHNDRLWERGGVVALVVAAVVGATAIYVGNSDSAKQRRVMQAVMDLTIVQLRPKLALELKTAGDCPPDTRDSRGKTIIGTLITPVWINHGGTEGIGFQGWESSKYFTQDAPTDFNSLEPPYFVRNMVETSIDPGERRVQGSRCFPDDDIQNASKGIGKLIFYGYIEYREVLPGKRAHHIHWCYQIMPLDRGYA